MARPEPNQIVDRESEAEVFAAIIQERSSRRILAVSDKPGRGKTDLLRKLRYQCEWLSSPAVPVALFDFDSRGVVQVVDILVSLAEQFADGTVPIELPRFETLSRARALENASQLRTAWGSVRGSINLTGANLSGEAQAAGVINNIEIRHADNVSTNYEWSEKLERYAQRLCVEAFFADLLKAATERPVVLLFDTVNSADADTRRWLLTGLILRWLLRNWRSHKLIVVIAGTDVNELLQPLPANQRECIEPAPTLAGWEIDHVRAFLALHGCDGLDDRQIVFMKESIAKGQSLVRAIQIAQLLMEQD